MGSLGISAGAVLIVVVGIVAFILIILAVSGRSGKKDSNTQQAAKPANPAIQSDALKPSTETPQQKAPSGPVTAICAGCGAPAQLKSGQSAVCEYCGAAINAK
ncbi:MAG TPA: hypothetical protein VN540_10795 [Clostridia bacterium]|nr:hypothetical protein [Clostridia bacterium]